MSHVWFEVGLQNDCFNDIVSLISFVTRFLPNLTCVLLLSISMTSLNMDHVRCTVTNMAAIMATVMTIFPVLSHLSSEFFPNLIYALLLESDSNLDNGSFCLLS